MRLMQVMHNNNKNYALMQVMHNIFNICAFIRLSEKNYAADAGKAKATVAFVSLVGGCG